MYHDVAAEGERSSSGFTGAGADRYTLTPELFSAHLDAIAAAGRGPRLVTEAGDERGVALTFDDGGRSSALTIAPMLAERRWRVHFLITTELIGTRGFVGEDELRALAAEGHAIGSHGHTHRVMTTLADAEISEEWRRSKAVLEDVLGAPVTVLSVPTGFYTSRVGRIAAEAGYRHLFTSEPRVRPRSLSGALVYGRFSVLASTPAARVEQLCRFSRGALWREGAKWYAKRVPKTLLRGHYERVRRFVLARQATIWRSGEREAR